MKDWEKAANKKDVAEDGEYATLTPF